jgi:protein SCO1/2
MPDQYAHASGLVILTPQGKVARYLFGVTYAPADVFQALAEASANKVGSPVQRLILLCFHYNPITGKYGAAIMLVIRLLSAATVLGLLGLIVTLARNRGRAGEPKQPIPSAPDALQPAPKP